MASNGGGKEVCQDGVGGLTEGLRQRGERLNYFELETRGLELAHQIYEGMGYEAEMDAFETVVLPGVVGVENSSYERFLRVRQLRANPDFEVVARYDLVEAEDDVLPLITAMVWRAEDRQRMAMKRGDRIPVALVSEVLVRVADDGGAGGCELVLSGFTGARLLIMRSDENTSEVLVRHKVEGNKMLTWYGELVEKGKIE